MPKNKQDVTWLDPQWFITEDDEDAHRNGRFHSPPKTPVDPATKQLREIAQCARLGIQFPLTQ